VSVRALFISYLVVIWGGLAFFLLVSLRHG
jgi:hypothetical protein